MQARLLIACPDRHGIVAAVSGFPGPPRATIATSSDEYSTDPEGGAFFMRMAFTIDALDEGFVRAFASEVAEPFAMDWRRTTPGEQSASRCWSRARTTVCRTSSGAGGAASSTASSRS